MDNTWVKLYRKIIDSPVLHDEKGLKVFIWLLAKVDKRTGEKVIGRHWASEELRLKPSTFYKVLKRLEKKHKIVTTKSNNEYTTVSLLNWAKYNPYREKVAGVSNNKGTTKEQQSSTLQEYKNKDIKTIGKPIQKTAVYGNPDINFLLTYLKDKLGLPLLDDSERVNRRYAQLCIQKFGLDKTRLAIDATAQSRFWHTKVTSFKTLYYNAVQIVSSNRGEVKSLDATKVVGENERREGVYPLGQGLPGVEASVTERA